MYNFQIEKNVLNKCSNEHVQKTACSSDHANKYLQNQENLPVTNTIVLEELKRLLDEKIQKIEKKIDNKSKMIEEKVVEIVKQQLPQLCEDVVCKMEEMLSKLNSNIAHNVEL